MDYILEKLFLIIKIFSNSINHFFNICILFFSFKRIIIYINSFLFYFIFEAIIFATIEPDILCHTLNIAPGTVAKGIKAK